MLYMTVWAIKHRTSVNNFAYETAEINIELKHLHRNLKILILANIKLFLRKFLKKQALWTIITQ